jgi:glycosyltransferase involved in cell wall biosynthesis
MFSTKQLTILHVAAPAEAGGLESVLLDLMSGLKQAGHRVGLAAVLDHGTASHPVAERAVTLGIHVFRLEIPPRAYLREYKSLRRVIAEFGPDVVHTHGYRADLVCGRAARGAGVPWVTTVHGFSGGDWKNRLYEWLQVRAYRRADAVLAVSRPIRAHLVESGVPIDRVHLLPNAWTPKPIIPREEARRRLGLAGSDWVVGWVGRLSREKGADVFLEALALLPQSGWTASIIGAGDERPALETRVRALGISDRLRWHGLLPNAAALYRAFDVWVLSSRTEGTPIALFEAMAARVPVVATTVGGVPDVVSSAEALLVPSEQPRDLAAAIATVLADTAQAALRAEAAYRRLTEAYSPGGWLDAHVALYRSLALTSSPGA